MRTAAGHTVSGMFRGPYTYDRNVLIKGELLSEGHFLCILSIVETEHIYRGVGPDHFICQPFTVLGNIPVDYRRLASFRIRWFVLQTDVDGHVIFTHVKAAVHAAAFLIEDSRKNVLAAMALHVIETTWPIQRTVYTAAFVESLIGGKPVNHSITIFLNIDDV